MSKNTNTQEIGVKQSLPTNSFTDVELLLEKVLVFNTKMVNRYQGNRERIVGNAFKHFYENTFYKKKLILEKNFYSIFSALYIEEYFLRKNKVNPSFYLLDLNSQEEKTFLNLYDELFSIFDIKFTEDSKIYLEVLEKNSLILDKLDLFRNSIISNPNFIKVFLHNAVGYFNVKVIKPENLNYLKTFLNNLTILSHNINLKITNFILNPELKKSFVDNLQINFNDGLNFLLKNIKISSDSISISDGKILLDDSSPENYLKQNEVFIKILSENLDNINELPFFILSENFTILNNLLNIDRLNFTNKNMIKWDSTEEALKNVNSYTKKKSLKNSKLQKNINLIADNIKNPYINYQKGESLNIVSDKFKQLYNIKPFESEAEYKLNWLKKLVYLSHSQNIKLSSDISFELLFINLFGNKPSKKSPLQLINPSLLFSTSINCKIVNIRFGEIDKVLKQMYSLLFTPLSNQYNFEEEFENTKVFFNGTSNHPIYQNSVININTQITGICEEGLVVKVGKEKLLERLKYLCGEYCNYEHRDTYNNYFNILKEVLTDYDYITGITSYHGINLTSYSYNFIASDSNIYFPQVKVTLNPIKSIEYFGNKEIKLFIANQINQPNGNAFLKDCLKSILEQSSKINLNYTSANLNKKGIKDPISVIHLNLNDVDYKFCLDDFEIHVESLDAVKIKSELFFKTDNKSKLKLTARKTKFKVINNYGDNFKKGDIITYLGTIVPPFLAYNSGVIKTKELVSEDFIEVQNNRTNVISYIQFKNINPYVEFKKKVAKKVSKEN